VHEIWYQMYRELPDLLTRNMSQLVSQVFVDSDINFSPSGRLADRNDEPLLINIIGSWNKRPQATTEIPNLFLASDYVQTKTNLATMEGANEAARLAVNGIFKSDGRSDRAKIFNFPWANYFPIERDIDCLRFKNNLMPIGWDLHPFSSVNEIERVMSQWSSQWKQIENILKK